MTGIRSYLEQSSLARTLWRRIRIPWYYAAYLLDFRRFSQMLAAQEEKNLRWQDRLPCLFDRTAATGFDHHYVYHTAWAARCLAADPPDEHNDIGSSLYFAAIVSAFVPVKFHDYRPAALHLTNLACSRADLLNLPFADRSISSLSCMHVLEHVGLGRYGDPLDPSGDLKAARELQRVLAPGGQLLMVAPVGRQRIAFNAHRIYYHQTICSFFQELLLEEFTLIPDDPARGLLSDATPQQADSQQYGCGCFRFRRP